MAPGMTYPILRRAKVVRTPTAREAAETACRLIVERVTAKPDLVLGLATGRSQLDVYRGLVAAHRAGDVSFARACSFNLDEYIGLPPSHPASFHAYMNKNFFDLVDLPSDRSRVPDGLANDPNEEARCYEMSITEAGGIDLQLLGIGVNGHIGFNEPGSSETAGTRVATLSAATRSANQRDFADGEAVPEQAITMGIATILAAREIVMVATGLAKRDAVRRALDRKVSSDCPASFLQHHPFVTLICDAEAFPD